MPCDALSIVDVGDEHGVVRAVLADHVPGRGRAHLELDVAAEPLAELRRIGDRRPHVVERGVEIDLVRHADRLGRLLAGHRLTGVVERVIGVRHGGSVHANATDELRFPSSFATVNHATHRLRIDDCPGGR